MIIRRIFDLAGILSLAIFGACFVLMAVAPSFDLKIPGTIAGHHWSASMGFGWELTVDDRRDFPPDPITLQIGKTTFYLAGNPPVQNSKPTVFSIPIWTVAVGAVPLPIALLIVERMRQHRARTRRAAGQCVSSTADSAERQTALNRIAVLYARLVR